MTALAKQRIDVGEYARNAECEEAFSRREIKIKIKNNESLRSEYVRQGREEKNKDDGEMLPDKSHR